MNSIDTHGTLVFFRKNGQAGTSYQLCSGKTTIGSSKDANIRLKVSDERLELIHCIIDVNDRGIATLLNKSLQAPVKVNAICVRKVKVLNHEDKIELIGKQFQYLNENLSSEDVEKHKKIAVLSPNRHSIAPLIKSAKKSPSLRIKPPFQRRTSIRTSFAGSSTDFAASVTPARNPIRRSGTAKSNTTSKVVVSKALGSPRPRRKLRLSLGNNSAGVSESPKISTRNILLSENIVSSTITEEELASPKPSVSMKDHEESQVAGEFLDESNVTVENSPPKKKMSLRTPSKSSIKITVTEVTPKVKTPANKIMESLKTPISLLKTSSPSSGTPRSTKKVYRSKSFGRFDDCVSTVGTPTDRIKKNNEESEASVAETVTKEVVKPRLSRRSKLIDVNEENLLNQQSPRNIPSRATLGEKEKPTHTDSEELSSGESVKLNLSTGSSVSPIKSPLEKSLLSSGNKYSSPRRSILKRSLRKSRVDQLKLSMNGTEEVHSSSEELDIEWKTNDPREGSFHNKSARKSRTREETQSSSEESSESLNEEVSEQKSATKSRLSSRRSRITEGHHEEVQSSSEELANDPHEDSVQNKSARKSRMREETQSLSEESSESLNEDVSVQKSATKSRPSSRRSRIAEGHREEVQSSSEELANDPQEDSVQSKSARKSRTREETQSSSEKSPEPLNEGVSKQKSATKPRVSSRRSRFTEGNREEMQSSSEESSESPIARPNTSKQDNSMQGTSAKSRRSSRRSKMTEEQLETQSSSGESLRLDAKTDIEANEAARSPAKLRQSLRRNSTKIFVHTPIVSITTFSRAEESFIVAEMGSPDANITRSNIVEDVEMQVSSESGSPDKSNRGSPRKREDPLLTSDSDSPGKPSKSRRSDADAVLLSSSEDSFHLRLSESPQLTRRSNVSSGRQSQRRSRPNGSCSSSGSAERSEEERQPRRSSMGKTEEPAELNESVRAANVTIRRTSVRQSMRKSAKINEERSLNEKSLISENGEAEKEENGDDENLQSRTPNIEIPKELNSSVRKSARISKRRESEARANITETETSRINKNESLKEKTLLSKNEADELSSSEDESPDYSLVDSATPKEQNLSMRKTARTSGTSESKMHRAHSANVSTTQTPRQRRSSIGKSEVTTLLSENEAELLLSSDEESAYSADRNTPKLRHSSVRKSHLSQSENEDNEAETSLNKSSMSGRRSMSKSTPINKLRKASLGAYAQNISIISLHDSVDSTPENNTSIIIVDTPLEKTRRSKHKKLSKTVNSTIQDDDELTTPKSVIKSRRSKSLPYKPLTEDITPVSPLGDSPVSKGEAGFKTPLNTPGLFENIRKSVLKSRSRSQRSGSNLLEELNREEADVKTNKRPRESSGSSARTSKRRKVAEVESDASFSTDSEDVNATFDSFCTEDILSDISDQNVCQKTPEYFKDLTDKPVINEPRTRSLTEPKKIKSKSLRRSLHAMRLDTQLSSLVDSSQKSDGRISTTSYSSDQSDVMFENSTNSNASSRRSSRRSSLAQSVDEQEFPKKVHESPENDLSDVAGLKKLLKTPKERVSPKNDLTDIRGVRKLLQTPKSMKSPKNDLTNVPNLRKFVSPKAVNSPKNDLTNIVGVKKLFSTPKEQKSPRNDLRTVPNLRRLMSPKQQNSPKNDLSDVAGLKKLLSTPKQVKSPENDLRNVPNLRRLMSPKVQNSPRNDLSDVAGVKKLLSTPKAQNSPRNDLTNVPNLRRIMSPKQQNSPKNDLTDIRGLKRLMKTPRKTREPVDDLTDVEGVASVFNMSGVQRLSNESDIENNEDLFDKLFGKRPPRTYRGKSLSPLKKSASLGDQRKTLGDTPLTSPRVERWVEEQAIMKAGNDSDEVFEEDKADSSKRRRQEDGVTKKVKGQKEALLENKVAEESSVDSPREGKRRRRIRGKEIYEDSKRESQEKKDNIYVGEEFSVEITSKERKLAEESKVDSPIEGRKRRGAKDDTKEEETVPKRGLRGQKRVQEIAVDENKPESPRRTPRGRRKVAQTEEKPKETSTPLMEITPIEENASTETETKKKPTRSRRKADKEPLLTTDDHEEAEVDSTSAVNFKPPLTKRGRAGKASQKKDTEDQIAEVHSTTEEVRSSSEVEEKDDASTDTEIVVPRRGRARNVLLRERIDSTEDITVREVQSPRLRSTRGKKKIPAENSELEVVPQAVEVSTRRGRRRNVNVEEENIEKNGRGDRLASVDERADEESDSSAISTRSTRARKENAVETTHSKKPSRSRKVADKVKIEESSNLERNATEALEELPKVEKTVKNTRGRRAPKQSEEEVETPEVVKRGRSKKKVEEETEDHHDTKDVKPTKTVRSTRRGAKNLVVEQDEDVEEAKSPVVAKKPTRSRKKTFEEDVKEEIKESEPTKSTRSRRQKTQEQPKHTDTSDEKEDIVTRPTNKRTRGKTFEEETVDVDSPRTTRAKRGNFKKYGSDFVTEASSPRREGQSKKTVRFEEAQANDEGGDSRKRRGRNAVAAEENEETIRRSKRTRK